MYTQCPNCDTQFELGIAELRSANGKLRCGHCSSIFNALLNLSEQAPEVPTIMQRPGSPARVDSPDPAPPELILLPEQHLADSARPAGVARPANIAKSAAVVADPPPVLHTVHPHPTGGSRQAFRTPPNETGSPPPAADRFVISPGSQNAADASALYGMETVRSQPVSDSRPGRDEQVHWSADDAPAADTLRQTRLRDGSKEVTRLRRAQSIDELPPIFSPDRRDELRPGDSTAPFSESDDMYHDLLEPAREPRSGGWLAALGWLIGVVILLGLLAAQYAYFMRGDLAQYAVFRPGMEKFCATIGSVVACRLPLRQDTSQITQLDDQVKLHPSVEDALLATVTLVNKAGFIQPYPQVQLTLSRPDGTVAAKRRFHPNEYLAAGADVKAGMAPGVSVPVSLELAMPSPDFKLGSWSFDLY